MVGGQTKSRRSKKKQFLILSIDLLHSHSALSSGMVEIESRFGRCLLRLSLANASIQDGTSHPEATITLAMFRRNGLSSSV